MIEYRLLGGLKILGGFVSLLGVMIAWNFPWIGAFQPDDLANGGIALGIVLIGLGVFLMKS